MKSEMLSALGLPEKLARVYLAALCTGTASVQDIANKAGLKRPSTYLHINELVREGLLERVPIGKKEFFRAAHPSVLQECAERRLHTLLEAMPEFLALQAKAHERPKLTILEGRKGLAQIYDEVAKSSSVRFWSNLAMVKEMFPEETTHVTNMLRENKIRAREIIADVPESRRAAKFYKSFGGSTYSVRVATMDGIESDNMIFGNVVALCRIHAYDLFVVRIEDPSIAQGLKAIFDMAWTAAKPLQGPVAE